MFYFYMLVEIAIKDISTIISHELASIAFIITFKMSVVSETSVSATEAIQGEAHIETT